MSKSWDNNILKKLKALVGKGLSTAEMGKRLGISKNAVVGKLHRLGWNAKANDVADTKSDKQKNGTEKKTATKKTGAVVREAKPVKAPKTPKDTKSNKKSTSAVAKPSKTESKQNKAVGRGIATKGGGVHERVIQHALEMANLKTDQCRWPIGDPDSDGFHFCGAPVFVGKPYCYEHCKQAYQFTPPKKK